MAEIKSPESKLVEIHGPTVSEDYRLIVDGYQVPYVKLRRLKNNDEPTALDAMESWQVLIDDRLSAVVTKSELNTWGYILANAMAVAAGYTSHGPNSRPINRHGPPAGNPTFSHHHWTMSNGDSICLEIEQAAIEAKSE